MDSERKRYAVGDFGKLYQFQGGDVPAGATPLVEEHDDSLTDAGKSYCENGPGRLALKAFESCLRNKVLRL